MSNKVSSSLLDESTVDLIKSQVRKKHLEYSKLNDIMGSQIFSILELNSRVLFYPLEDDEVWGFSERIKGQSFVCINTSIPYDKQIFASAHELYHLWYDNEEELILSSALEETQQDTTDERELKANRFAAEFLVSEVLLKQEMETYSIAKSKIDIKKVLQMSNLFLIPYKTMVRRFYEIKIIGKRDFESLMAISSEDIDVWRMRLGFSLPVREQRIGLDNLIDRALELYEKKLITYEKLEYLLSFAQLTPIQLGIPNAGNYVPPTDEELQSILEE